MPERVEPYRCQQIRPQCDCICVPPASCPHRFLSDDNRCAISYSRMYVCMDVSREVQCAQKRYTEEKTRRNIRGQLSFKSLYLNVRKERRKRPRFQYTRRTKTTLGCFRPHPSSSSQDFLPTVQTHTRTRRPTN